MVDFFARPLFLVLFSMIFTLTCISFIGAGLQLVNPLMSGFALVGPFAAIGLYEVSRRRELGLDTCTSTAGSCNEPLYEWDTERDNNRTKDARF